MIKAEHKKWAELIFDPYTNHLLRKNFNGFYVTGNMPDPEKYPGLIITPNHFSWWDGFITYYLIKKFSTKKIYTMMLEDQLKRYWFFKKVGAYSINQTNPVSIARTLEYTRNVLNDSNNIVVLYPQGEIQPLTSEDVIIKAGLKLVLGEKSGGKHVLPLALKIEYGNNRKPDIAASFGRIFTKDEIYNDYYAFINEFKTNINTLKAISDLDKCRNLF
jgi:hypothetical protein